MPLNANLLCRVGAVACRVVMLPLGPMTEVAVSLKDRVIRATPDATFEDLSRAVEDAERLEISGAWPPPRLSSLTLP